MDVFEFAVGDVGVDLRGGNVGVSQQCLHRADVGAVHQKIGGELVAQLVRGYLAQDARLARVELHEPLDGAGDYRADDFGVLCFG